MQITLRRANAVQASIQEALKSIVLKTEIAIDEFQNVTDTIKQCSEKLYSDIGRQKDLLLVLYTIREKVGEANANSGINSHLTNVSFISKRLEQLTSFVNATAAQDWNVLDAKLDKIRNAKESFYEKTVSTGVLSQLEIDKFKVEILTLKKKKVEISDALLALNVSTSIELDETTVTVLTKENLL